MKTITALTAAALTVALPCFVYAQSARPATSAPAPAKAPAKKLEDKSAEPAEFQLPPAELLLLSGIPYDSPPEKIIAYARSNAAKAADIAEPNLKFLIRSSLAQIEDKPADAATVRREHLMKMSDYFFAAAIAQKEADEADQAAKHIQIALRMDPSNAEARFFFGELLQQTGNTDLAIQTLQYGKQFLPLNAPIASKYLDFYYKLLNGKQRDRDIVQDTTILIDIPNYSPGTREVIAFHAAQANYWLGNYQTAREMLAKVDSESIARDRLRTAESLASEKQNDQSDALRYFANKRLADIKILEASIFFGAGDTATATSKLEKAVMTFPGAARDAILAQLARFHIQLRQYEQALAVARQRITEAPAGEPNPYPRVQRLYLLEKTGRKDVFDRELGEILAKFNDKQSAIITLAEFASKYGRTDICARCAQIAEEQHFDLPIFTLLVMESLIRAGDPDGAITYYKAVLERSPNFFSGVQGSANALVGIAYLQAKNVQTGRAFLNEFLREKRTDRATREKIEALEIKRGGKYEAGKLVRPPTARYESERMAISDEIKRLSHKQRKIAAGEYISVAYFLRFVNAPEDALRILENGVYMHPGDSQIRADYISTRIICGATEKLGARKPLIQDAEELLNMRRPAPAVWLDILMWLETDKSVPPEKADALRASAKKLIRPDIDFSLMTGREPDQE